MLTKEQLKPHQTELMHLWGRYINNGWQPPKYVVLTGGVGTFKTTAAIRFLYAHTHAWALQYPDSAYGIIAKTYRQVQRVFIREWRKQVPRDKYTINSVRGIVNLHQAHTELVTSYADGEASEILRGENWIGYFMIQPETYRNMDIFTESERRAREFGPANETERDTCLARVKLFDFNAGSTSNWAYPILIDHESSQFVGGRLLQTIVKDGYTLECYENLAKLHVETTPKTSIYSQEFIDSQQKILPAFEFDRMFKGLWVRSEGRIFDDFKVLPKAPEPEDIKAFWIGLDPGTSATKLDPDGNKSGNMALIWIGLLKDGTYCVIDERVLKFTGMDTLAEVVENVSSYWNIDKYKYFIGDWHGGSGAVIRSELPKKLSWIGAVYQPAGGSGRARWIKVMNGVQLLYEALKTRTLTYSPKCTMLIRDSALYSYNEQGTEPNKRDFDSDLLDALRHVWIWVGRRIDNESIESNEF